MPCCLCVCVSFQILENIREFYQMLHNGRITGDRPNFLILCKIWGFRDGNYEECRLMECDAVRLL
jgi:hypothetical protein